MHNEITLKNKKTHTHTGCLEFCHCDDAAGTRCVPVCRLQMAKWKDCHFPKYSYHGRISLQLWPTEPWTSWTSSPVYDQSYQIEIEVTWGKYTQWKITIPILAGFKSLEDQRSKAHWGHQMNWGIPYFWTKPKHAKHFEQYHQLSSGIPMIAG